MVMPNFEDNETTAAAGAGAGADNEEGRRPTMVSAPAPASPELVDRPRRRTFTARDKVRILDVLDQAAGTPGAIGAILCREGVYSASLVK